MGVRDVVSREDWLAAREELLTVEKELTRQRDAVNAQRRALPMVEIEDEYRFEGPDGPASLLDLFDGRRQLVVYHFMFDPDRPAPTQPTPGEGCVSCSRMVDGIGHLAHLHARDTTLVLVSRAPLDRITAFKERMGWTIPWFSSAGSAFNHHFHATLEFEEYTGEAPGASVFVREDGRILHSYSTTARGLDGLITTYNWLDLTPLGRQEGWGGTIDLTGEGIMWARLHDRYDQVGTGACCGGSS